MANFSVNQVKQMYVASEILVAPKTAKDITKVGGIVMAQDKDGNIYFNYKSADGTIVRSDLIDPESITSVIAAPGKVKGAKQAAIVLSEDVIDDNGNVVSGQDFIARIAISHFAGMSDEDVYFKYGAVHATKKMSLSKFYATLAVSFVWNFSREVSKLFKFYLASAGGNVEVTTKDTVETLLADDSVEYTGVIIEEDIEAQEKEWVLGTKSQEEVFFEVFPSTVTIDGDEVIWGGVEYSESATITTTNATKIADLEYFCMGERGDQYRNMGWPNVIPTKYLVSTTTSTGAAASYSILSISYSYQGSCEDIQKSEKEILIAAQETAAGTLNSGLVSLANKIKELL